MYDLISHQFWPTTFFCRVWPDHPREVAGLVDHLYRLRGPAKSGIESRVAPSAKSPYGLYESPFDLFASPNGNLQRLKAFIVSTLQDVAISVNRSALGREAVQAEVVDGWFHITNDGGFHDAHGHGGCSWCGIYYIQLGDTPPVRARGEGAPNGGNRFYSPFLTGGAYRDFGNRYLDRSYLDPPAAEGMLLLFPSYLTHSALPYRGVKDRIVIAFNARIHATEADHAPGGGNPNRP